MKNSTGANPKTNSSPKNRRIKVRLDARTLIVLSSMSIFKMWKSRFPEARIIG